MIFDYFTVKALTEELSRELSGSRIVSALRIGAQEVLLKFREKPELFISSSPQYARVFLTHSETLPQEGEDWLPKYFRGARIEEIKQPGLERILKIKLSKQDRIGTKIEAFLIVELIGRYSNAILINQEGDIIDSLRRVTSQMSRFRQILPGMPYVAPPPQDKINPCKKEDQEAFKRRIFDNSEGELISALVRLVSGMSRLVASELISCLGFSPQTRPTDLNNEELEALWKKLSEVYENFHFSGKASVVLNEYSAPSDLSPIEITSVPEESKIRLNSISKAIEYFFSRKIKNKKKEELKNSLSKSIQKASKSSHRKLEKLATELEDAKNANLYSIKGDLLMANIGQIKKGLDEVELKNLYRPEEGKLKIKLDPKLSILENAQKYFRKARKAKAGRKVIKEHIASEKKRLEKLDSYKRRLEKLERYEDLVGLQKQLMAEGYVKSQKKGPKKETKEKGGINPREYITEEGWKVLVGRNNRENDYLSLRVARGNDFWFHARDFAGSHVILRRRDKKEPRKSTLKKVASLAAYWSKAKKGKNVAVSYTLAKYVKKPKDAKPGAVNIAKEKTIFADPKPFLEKS